MSIRIGFRRDQDLLILAVLIEPARRHWNPICHPTILRDYSTVRTHVPFEESRNIIFAKLNPFLTLTPHLPELLRFGTRFWSSVGGGEPCHSSTETEGTEDTYGEEGDEDTRNGGDGCQDGGRLSLVRVLRYKPTLRMPIVAGMRGMASLLEVEWK